eukprot:TRINITY_DN15280_c0_g1_i1.p1 TRINITY_DN15280_c0_g1~~TRINITY_DN15280_c0_g1_i1.p1  ORF type:complete len:337 (-),score=84.32 TRINITY_DN15280_c0_g1_i1:78-1088(-)
MPSAAMLRRLIPGASKVAALPRRDIEADEEAPAPAARVACAEADHGAAPDEEDASGPLLANDLQMAEKRADIVWENVKKQTSMKKVMKIVSTQVEGAWTADVEEVPGNIYNILAFGGSNRPELQGCEELSWSFAPVCIFLIQLVGNSSIAIANYPLMTDMQIGFDDWKRKPATKLLGVLFMFILCVNGLVHIGQEKVNWKRKYAVAHYFKTKGKVRDISMSWLWMGAFMNLWALVSTLGASYVCFATSSAPGDVMYNALALTFLYNLDDVGGDVLVVSPSSWPALGVGWLEKRVHEVHREPETPFYDFVTKASYYTIGLLAFVASIDLAITDFRLG